MDVLAVAEPGATFLLNAPFEPNEVWNHLPRKTQQQLIDKKIRFVVIDGYKVARETGMGSRINTIMQTGFFALSGVLPRDEAIAAIKDAIQKTYGKRGDAVVQKNFSAVEASLAHLHEVRVPAQATSAFDILAPLSDRAPKFVRGVLGTMMEGKGDDLPVSALPPDGTFPTNTARSKNATSRNKSLCGIGIVHSVRQVCPGLPPCRDPIEGLQCERVGGRAR